MSTHRSQVLRLYRGILQQHKRKLDPQMRLLGDQYVREEFRRHKTVSGPFVQMFMREWQNYYTMMVQKRDKFGVDLSPEEHKLFDADQQEKLATMRDSVLAEAKSKAKSRQ